MIERRIRPTHVEHHSEVSGSAVERSATNLFEPEAGVSLLQHAEQLCSVIAERIDPRLEPLRDHSWRMRFVENVVGDMNVEVIRDAIFGAEIQQPDGSIRRISGIYEDAGYHFDSESFEGLSSYPTAHDLDLKVSEVVVANSCGEWEIPILTVFHRRFYESGLIEHE
jgi:hypothetical protein